MPARRGRGGARRVRFAHERTGSPGRSAVPQRARCARPLHRLHRRAARALPLPRRARAGHLHGARGAHRHGRAVHPGVARAAGRDRLPQRRRPRGRCARAPVRDPRRARAGARRRREPRVPGESRDRDRPRRAEPAGRRRGVPHRRRLPRPFPGSPRGAPSGTGRCTSTCWEGNGCRRSSRSTAGCAPTRRRRSPTSPAARDGRASRWPRRTPPSSCTGWISTPT